MENETIDKLKNAGYITVTDDSQGIADKVGIGGGGGGMILDLSAVKFAQFMAAWNKHPKGYFNFEDYLKDEFDLTDEQVDALFSGQCSAVIVRADMADNHGAAMDVTVQLMSSNKTVITKDLDSNLLEANINFGDSDVDNKYYVNFEYRSKVLGGPGEWDATYNLPQYSAPM